MKREVFIKFLNSDPIYDMREAALNTINKTVSTTELHSEVEKLMWKYLVSEHSPIRAVTMRITLKDIDPSTSVHFARHVHSIPYVSTSRPDRTGEPRGKKVTHMFYINLQCLIDMARKRLCKGSCAEDTYKWMVAIKQELYDIGGIYREISNVLVPNCIYRGGKGSCPEFNCCHIDTRYTGSIPQRYSDYETNTIRKE